MKRVGLITIHHSPNYGACLQSYALYKYIVQQGAYCEIIDVHRPIHSDYIYEKRYSSYRNNQFKPSVRIRKALKNIIKKVLGRETVVKQFTSPISEQRFKEFNSIIKYSQTYNRLSDLKKNPPVYDLYISGSDQLWNPAQPYCLEPYFLTFVPDGKKKISFATSIGLTELTQQEKSDFKRWLRSYDAVSVREKQGKALLDAFVERDIEQVADPTFLLDTSYWNEVAIFPQTKKKYILLFLLTANADILDYAVRLSHESGLELIVLKTSQLATTEEMYTVDNDCGPREFIGYLGHANMVITDSFHCTVFSLLMGAKNFYTYINVATKRGSRITDLLSTFGLEDHLLPTDFSKSYQELTLKLINREKIFKIIENEKKHARAFLDRWIKA